MAVYLTKSYFKGVVDLGFYAKVLLMSIIMFGLLFSLSQFVSNSIMTLIPYTIIGSAVLLVSVHALGLLTVEDERYLEHFVPGKLGKLMRVLVKSNTVRSPESVSEPLVANH